MPQKRNPDAAELCRAKVGRIAGAFQGLLMVMKGLPLTYAKDMQEDKETTFDALRSFAVAVAAMRGMIEDLEPDPDAMRAAAGRGYATATDLADWLVRELKLPFREAHHVTGAIVKRAERPGDWPRGAAARGHAGGGTAHHQGCLCRSRRSKFRPAAAPALVEPRHRMCAKWREPG